MERWNNGKGRRRRVRSFFIPNIPIFHYSSCCDSEETTMSLKEGVVVNVERAESVGRYRLNITFSDGHVSIVDFGPFLQSSLNPETQRFLDVELFRNFNVIHGNLVWGDYNMCFSVDDIYEGHIGESSSSAVSARWGEAGSHKSGKILAVAEDKAEYITNKRKHK
jgi:prepilin-type processing-associated H-X9-DG protein